jgi:GH25 family lysozyme M1 (1,4-beta-N-acetylmuramidase)
MVDPLEARLFMARLTGIDVSHFQGTMNWNTAVSQGISFAIIRASRSDTLPDTQLAANMNASTGAKAKGLVVGVYHRILPFGNTSDIRQDSGEGTDANYIEPETDAQNYYNSGKNYMGKGYIRPVVDVENGANLNTTPHVNAGGTPTATTNLSQWVTRFVTKLKQLWSADNGGAVLSPMIYTGHYRSNLDSTVIAAMPDLWIANWESSTYGNPITGSGSPPISPWPAWDFWQWDSAGNQLADEYGSSNPETSDIDLDVFNGSDINVLKAGYVTGAAAIPSGPSPANGATNVSPIGLTLNWADSANATAYDVYVDGVLKATNLAQSQWTVSPQLAGGSHNWRVVAKGVIGDDDTHTTTLTNWTFTASSLPLPGTPTGGTPDSTIVTSKPLVLDWADASNAATYDVYLGAAANLPLGTPSFTGLTSSQTSSISPAEGARLWRVVARNATGDAVGPLWSYTLDTVAPTASYGAQTPTNGSANFDFTVTYGDATSGVDFTTIDSSDIVVNGPNGYSQSATLIGVDLNSNGSPRVATYRVAAPGGSWDAADNGDYTVVLNTNQVKDVGGLAATSISGNTFNVNLVQPFAYKVGSVLHVDFDGAESPSIGLAYGDGTVNAARNSSILNFTGVTSIVATGSTANDKLDISGDVPLPLTFNGGAGDDDIAVTFGTYTFTSDVSAGGDPLNVTVAGGSHAVFASTQHIGLLKVNGSVSMPANGNRVLVVNDVNLFNGAGKIDLADNDMVIDYTGASPVGTSNGATYSGIAGLIQAGHNGGSWDGGGIYTSRPDAAGGLTTLGIGEAGAILGIDGDATAAFSGQTVDATAVLIKYTYSGDANLDGVITGDDYSAIDFTIQVPGSADYFNGDFNYDGAVTGDDYSAIDFNIIAQGLPL